MGGIGAPVARAAVKIPVLVSGKHVLGHVCVHGYGCVGPPYCVGCYAHAFARYVHGYACVGLTGSALGAMHMHRWWAGMNSFM